MREYSMYFPFFILYDWGKRSAEARGSHCAVLPLLFQGKTGHKINIAVGVSATRIDGVISFSTQQPVNGYIQDQSHMDVLGELPPAHGI